VRIIAGEPVVIHPEVEELVPDMDVEQLSALREDMRVRGQLEAIVIATEGTTIFVIDGIQRHRVCEELGMPCRAREWDGTVPPRQLRVSLNVNRRHLTPSQQAILALEFLPKFEAEAKVRQAVGRRKGGKIAGQRRTNNDTEENLPQSKPNKRSPQASDLAGNEAGGVSGKYVREAKAIAKRAPELVKSIRDGAISINEAKPLAAKLAQLPQRERTAVAKRTVKAGFLEALKGVAPRSPASQGASEYAAKMAALVQQLELVDAHFCEALQAAHSDIAQGLCPDLQPLLALLKAHADRIAGMRQHVQLLIKRSCG